MKYNECKSPLNLILWTFVNAAHLRHKLIYPHKGTYMQCYSLARRTSLKAIPVHPRWRRRPRPPRLRLRSALQRNRGVYGRVGRVTRLHLDASGVSSGVLFAQTYLRTAYNTAQRAQEVEAAEAQLYILECVDQRYSSRRNGVNTHRYSLYVTRQSVDECRLCSFVSNHVR